ncbi:MAG: hypothetical protein CVV05_00475 [Gammaproteobacteria bacterium HGW-Gammaproteobacteria-1]|jgi:ankyrin repeat protein|nr:MAG: hypothetical protein CVV05_00475 [Gammaproteobacteria bacterium HGW-Gammaproteobacteria-1]
MEGADVSGHLKATLQLVMSRKPSLSGSTTLRTAIQEEHWALARALLGCDVDPESRIANLNWPPLAYAVCARREDVMIDMLAAGARPSGKGGRFKGSGDALRMATLTRQPALITRLVAAGAEVERRDQRGRTALHDAARFDADHCIEALLDGGADIDALDDAGCPPIFEAICYGSCEAVRVLVRRGADLVQNYGDWGNVRMYARNHDRSSWLPDIELRPASPETQSLGRARP